MSVPTSGREFWRALGFVLLGGLILDAPILGLAILVGISITPNWELFTLKYIDRYTVSEVTQPYIFNLVIPSVLLVWRLVLNVYVVRKEFRNSGAVVMLLYFVWALFASRTWQYNVPDFQVNWMYWVPPVLWVVGSKVIWRLVKVRLEPRATNAASPQSTIPVH